MKYLPILVALLVFGCSTGDQPAKCSQDLNTKTIPGIKTGIEDNASKPAGTKELVISKDSRTFYNGRELKDSSSVYNLIREFSDKNFTVGIVADSTAKVGAFYKVLNACTRFKVRLYVRTKAD